MKTLAVASVVVHIGDCCPVLELPGVGGGGG